MLKIIHKSIQLFVLLLTFTSLSYAANEYEVYSDFIKQFDWERLSQSHSTTTTFVIMNKTNLERYGKDWNFKEDRFKNRLKGVTKELIKSFEKANKTPLELDAKSFKLPNVIVVTKEDTNTIFDKGGWWSDFYKKYPNSQGVLTLSRVGLSKDGNKALLFFDNGWGGKAGGSAVVLLAYKNKHWVIEQFIPLWSY